MDMNRRGILMVVICVVFVIAMAVQTYAADGATSSGTIAFTNKTTTDPVDPENPENPQDPPEVPSTGNSGALTLDVVPFPKFGTHERPTVNTWYNAKIVEGTGTPGNYGPQAQTFIQVTDTRSANSGWNVKVTASAFKVVADTDTIEGARIHFLQGRVNGLDMANAASAHEGYLNCTNVVAEQTTVSLFSAAADKGVHTWVSRLYPASYTQAAGADNTYIKVYVPANAAKAAGYSCTLTWDLFDTP